MVGREDARRRHPRAFRPGRPPDPGMPSALGRRSDRSPRSRDRSHAGLCGRAWRRVPQSRIRGCAGGAAGHARERAHRPARTSRALRHRRRIQIRTAVDEAAGCRAQRPCSLARPDLDAGPAPRGPPYHCPGMRSLLLWCAQNMWLSEHVPQWGFVKRAVKRFMPGEDFDAALKAGDSFKAQGIGAVFTKLGENIKAMSEATAAVEHYELVLKTAADAGARANGFLWIDMEGSAYTDRTLGLYNRVHARHSAVGVCLQAYLYRTASDAYRMLAFKPAIRLVKGAYAEPADRAF